MNFHSPKIEEHMRFICPECGLDLPTQIIWRKHLNTSHDYNKKTVDVFNFKEINSRYHECNECHKWVANGNQSITTLQYHRISHLPYNLTFKCRHCIKAFARKRALCDHLLNEHKDLLKDTNLNLQPPTHESEIDTPKKQVGNLDEFGMDDYYNNKKDPGDLIQKALLDSLIDLENETLADFSQNSEEVNDFALNQSLNELEAILKGDFEVRNLSEQYINREQPLNQYGTEIIAPEQLEDDNELLEQICADIFEEVEETVEQVKSEPTHQLEHKDKATFDKDDMVKEHNTIEPYEEKIISIEIDTINESERRNMYSSPKRKRLKIDMPPSRTLEMDGRIKRLLETFIVYLCPECGREYKTQSEWRDHVFKVHDLTNTMHGKYQALRNGTANMCLECRQVLKTSKIQELMRHRFTHMPFKSYLKCTFCAKTKSSKPKIMQHMQNFHAGTLAVPFIDRKVATHLVCSFCQKAFQTRERLQAHRQNCNARQKNARSKQSNDSNITNNLNLIVHLKKMRARMRSLVSADDSKVGNKHHKNNY